jgi:hypothetical protein
VFDHPQAGVESLPGAIASEETGELAMPHALLVFDVLLEQTSVIGPFAEPLAALVFAERYIHEVGGAPGDLIVTVAALEPM